MNEFHVLTQRRWKVRATRRFSHGSYGSLSASPIPPGIIDQKVHAREYLSRSSVDDVQNVLLEDWDTQLNMSRYEKHENGQRESE